MSTHPEKSMESPTFESTRWRIDPARSRVEFEVPHNWGLSRVRGRFTRYDGTLALADDPALVLTIEAASLDTKSKYRDKHLRSAEFFDADNHPHPRFVSESVELDGERLTVRGRLHAAGKSVPLEIDATLTADGDELEVEAFTDVDQRLLGMTWSPLGIARTPTRLLVHARLVRDAG
ncbi:MAG TPA: YceI family protein [Gaiellaceae bacterium]|nr:YceI family protein [Gaiellaceae bacterium]